MAENFANTFQTVLAGNSGSITSGATTFVVSSATGVPSVNFRVLVDSEIMIVTGVSGTTFTVTRGAEGTTAATHLDGALCTHILTAAVLALFPQTNIANTFSASKQTLSVSSGDGIWRAERTSASGSFFTGFEASASSITGRFGFDNGLAPSIVIGTTTSNALGFIINGAVKAQIDTSGQFGLGKTPTDLISARAAGTTSQNLIGIQRSDASAALGLATDSTGDATLNLYTVAGTQKVQISASATAGSFIAQGGLAIGTTGTPLATLEVFGGAFGFTRQTTVQRRLCAFVTGSLSVSTDASFTGRLSFSVADFNLTTGRTALQCDTDGTNTTVSISGKVSSYNSDTTAGNGVPAVVGASSLTAQAASIGSTTLFTTNAAGVYRISGQLLTTTAGSAGTVTGTVTWTDDSGAQSKALVASTSLTSLGAYNEGTVTVRVTASQAIAFSTTVTGATGSPKYASFFTVQRVQ